MTIADELSRILSRTVHVEPSSPARLERPAAKARVERQVAASLAARKVRSAKLNAEARWLVEHFDILPADDTVPTAVAAKIMGLATTGVRRHLTAASGGGTGNRCTYRVRDIRAWLEERGR